MPKLLPDRQPQRFSCGGIENKMGIHASPTCQMNFDGATGWLVGRPHKGMSAMFTMMNAARLGVGIQGLGLAEAAYQGARDYARRGCRAAASPAPSFPSAADPLIVHPDIRRMLLAMRARIEGARALAAWVAMAGDEAAKHPDPERRDAADDLVALMTPIVKASFTDMGFDCANLARCRSGAAHGYIRENGMEQLLRDARITQIYEGTNGIQALDLIGRKLGQGTGRLLRRFFHPVAESCRRRGRRAPRGHRRPARPRSSACSAPPPGWRRRGREPRRGGRRGHRLPAPLRLPPRSPTCGCGWLAPPSTATTRSARRSCRPPASTRRGCCRRPPRWSAR